MTIKPPRFSGMEMSTSRVNKINIRVKLTKVKGQPELKTIESMIEKTLMYVLGHTGFKILGSSRTDSKVSANHSAFELFVNKPVNKECFLKDFNKNLPNDIKAIKIEEKDKTFNIINDPRIKQYLYLFAFKEKSHPFCASLTIKSATISSLISKLKLACKPGSSVSNFTSCSCCAHSGLSRSDCIL